MAQRFHEKISFKNLSEGSQGWPLLLGNLEGLAKDLLPLFSGTLKEWQRICYHCLEEEV
jgi:hypothetical protein